MEIDPIEDAAHPSQTHAIPGSADGPVAGDTSSGEEDIIQGRNPTQRKIDEQRPVRSRPTGKGGDRRVERRV